MLATSNHVTLTTSKHRNKRVDTEIDEHCGRLRVIDSIMGYDRACLNVGSKEVHFGNNALNVDVDTSCRPNVVADARRLPFRSGIFEQVLFTEVIEHLPKGDEPRALRELYRILMEKGELILTTPNKRPLFTLLDPALYVTRHRHYTLTEVRKMLEGCGFSCVRIFTSGFLWACANFIWYVFITHPIKKIFDYSLPYVPLSLRSLEDKEYQKICEGGYTIFVKASKRKQA